MKTLTIINQKGGVGKSTTAHALGAAFTKMGYHVLFVDLDAQGNLSYTAGAKIAAHNALTTLQVPDTAVTAIQHTTTGDIIPSVDTLSGADTIITEVGKEYRLKEALSHVSQSYDYCIIDTPPALGVLTINALTASNGAIIPAQADIFSLQGITQLGNTIEAVKKYCNSDLKVKGIVLTRYNPRSIISQDITSMMKKTADSLNTILYRQYIRECTALKEAQALQQSIFDYAPTSNAAADYMELAKAIIQEEQQ